MTPAHSKSKAASILFCLCLVALALFGTCARAAQAADRLVPQPEGASSSSQVVPAIAGSQVARLRGIFRKGLARGNRPRSFIKVGDSISWTPLFLQGFSCGEQRLASRASLGKTIRWHRGLRLDPSSSDAACPGGGDDPFGRDSTSTRPYQFSGWPLRTPPSYPPGMPADSRCEALESPIECEARLLRPSIALVMLGTNDASVGVPPESVRSNLEEVVDWLIQRGSIPVLSTIPPRLDAPDRTASALSYNTEIRILGQEKRVPVIDLHRAFTADGMIAAGMSADGVHPSTLGVENCWWQNERCRSTDLRPNGLRYGHNRRNLIVLQTLERLRARVIAPVLRSSR